jgi:hypothetical protein
MATSLTDYSEQMLLKLALGTSVGSTSAGVYLALGLYDNGIYGPWNESGTGGTEIGTGLGYARAHIPFDGWDPIVSEQVSIPGSPSGTQQGRVWTRNTNPITFGPSTGPWGVPGINGQLRYGALFDAATGGNCLAYLDITGSPAEGVPVNKLMTFPAGSIKITLRSTSYTDTVTPTARYSVGGFTRQIMEYLLKHLTGQATYVPGPRWFALGNPVDYTSPHLGTFSGEVSGGSYARVSTAGLWGAPAGISNGQKIQLTTDVPFPTATANWGARTLTLVDSASGATNLIAGFYFTSYSPGIQTGERLVIRPADLIPRLIG